MLQGAEHQSARAMRAGADGLVPGIANLIPAPFCRLVENPLDEAMQQLAIDLGAMREHGHFMSTLKYAMSLCGFGSGRCVSRPESNSAATPGRIFSAWSPNLRQKRWPAPLPERGPCMYIPPRSVAHKVFEIWRSPERFTKNPDLIALPSGRLMLIYADTDAHWSMKNQVLTLLASDDEGRTWFKHREIDRADLTRGDERLVTPRLSLLNDGRLVVIVDHDDDGHFHEEQPPGNWLYWSEDEGDSWRVQHDNGIGGFEPDRVMDLPDGTLGVVSHLMRGEYQEFAEVLWVSADGGATWSERATVACDGYHRFCEGAIVLLHGGSRLACVLRENHSGGIPSFVTFSEDCGHSWSAPQQLPFAIHRPYAKQLNDGRVLVTGRHVNGGLGCYAWVGDLEAEAGRHVIGGPRRKFSASLEEDALVIDNRLEHECRYTLLPPESSFSEVDFEAELRVEASGNGEVAFLSISRLGVLVTVTPEGLRMQRGTSPGAASG